MDEGYYNVLPQNEKTTVNAMYNSLIHYLKRVNGMDPVANPYQFPPALYREDPSGKVRNIYKQ